MSYAGIDVAKDHLDLALRLKDENVQTRHFAHTTSGLDALVQHIEEDGCKMARLAFVAIRP